MFAVNAEPRLSQAALARALGVSPALIVKQKGQGMPVDSVEAAQAWRERHRRQYAKPTGRQKPAEHEEDVPFAISRARREAAEADIAEHKAAELSGDLVRRSVFVVAAERKANMVRESLLQLPAQLAPVVAAESDVAKCQDALMDAVLSILARINA